MRRTLLILVALLPAACTRADIVSRDAGELDATMRDAGQGDADADAGGGDAGCGYEPVDTTGMPAGCERRRPPGRPTCDSPDPAPRDRFYAIRAIGLSPTADTGLDVDGWCTAAVTDMGECEVDMSTGQSVDGPEGIDNAFANEFFPSLRGVYSAFFGSDIESDVNAVMESGFQNITVRLRGWNGRPDDRNVELTYASSVCGLGSADALPCPTAAPFTPPDWDDVVFYPAESSFIGGDVENPRFVDDGAYVSNGRLVARLPDTAPFSFATRNGTIRVEVRDAFVIFDIAEEGFTNGVIAGKIPRVDLELSAQAYGFCPTAPEYPMFVAAVDAALDVRAEGDGGPVPCNAVSVAIDAVGNEVSWGALQPDLPVPMMCP